MAYSYNNNFNNKDTNKPFEPNLYTPYRFNNAESSVDKTCLTFGIWKQALKIGIFPRKENTEEVLFDMDNGLTVYLNHSKAKMLANEIRNFLRDPDTYTGSGVHSGQGVITISNGAEFGVHTPILVIRKLDDTGNVVSSFAYEFKTNYYFSIRNYTGTTDFIKETDSYNNLEIEEMLTMLDEYCAAMTYMVAYSVMDANKYNDDRIMKRLNACAEKLGVEINRSSSSGSKFSSASNFFNNAGTNSHESYTSATLDDID